MEGPAQIIRSKEFPEFQNIEPIHEWIAGPAYLLVDRVRYQGHPGVIFTYNNPPVHQIGNPALDAYLKAFEKILSAADQYEFLILNTAADPVHAGGDLKESLQKLRDTKEQKQLLEARGASDEKIDNLYDWADARLDKGFALYRAVRHAAQAMRTIAVCAGGTRFGGSAEVPLMADFVIGDSRSAMCFSEAQIGLIPGWGGVGRAVSKAGLENARAMAMTCAIVRAEDLEKIGVYDRVVTLDNPLPRKKRTGDREADKAAFKKDLAQNNRNTALQLIPAALELATAQSLTATEKPNRTPLRPPAEIEMEVTRRQNPNTYRDLWGKPLKEVKQQIKKLGRPLAPQSIEQLRNLFAGVTLEDFEESTFIRKESAADARLYRDPRFEQGIIATLEQKVADFREVN
jgi:enoyl-CoA hydratase/carnithine racemase